MANGTITFFCPACGIKLTVPENLAGVEGPCPSCGSRIQAPQAAMPESVREPAVLKPEPRQLPNRPPASEVPARQMPEPVPRGQHRRVDGNPIRNHPYFRNLVRMMIFAAFLLASGALVYGVLTILKRQPPLDPALRTSEPFSFDKLIEDQASPDNGGNAGSSPDSTPAVAPTDPLEALEPVSPWKDAEAVLEKFLSAGSLAGRLPLIETQTPEEELAATCLAGPLPPTARIVPESRETNPAENIVDFYYTVEFKTGELTGHEQTILVRSRGGNPPKVVADPFLDTYGGRLAAYAAAPAEKGGIFQVVVYAVASCTNPNIPKREKKLTLKLLASDNDKEIARAYFDRQSKIGEMLEDGTYGLSYGSAKACTVMLRWNTEDNPQYPYLEALAIRDLGWDP